MGTTIEELKARIRDAARDAGIPIDVPVYERAGRDPLEPILFAGSLAAPLLVFGRDLGKDEVLHGQPLIGSGGKQVRQGILQSWEDPSPTGKATRERLEDALRHVLLSNTVPYKPPGNKAYSDTVKERFRPFILELLTRFWTGSLIITLGNEAFHWFGSFADERAFQEYGHTEDRFTHAFPCRLPVPGDHLTEQNAKSVEVLPLPHPSPLNRRWRAQFPEMLARRLHEIRTRR